MKEIYQVQKSGITAGFDVEDGIITKSASIINWVRGLKIDPVYKWFSEHDFKIDKLNSTLK